MKIPVGKPLLPVTADLVPLLQELDGNRVYSNFGPLVKRFEAELVRHFGVKDGGVVSTANGTVGLTLSLLPDTPGKLCLMPAWTFVATPLAAMQAGMIPCFADVGPETGEMEIDAVRDRLAADAEQIGAIVVVTPFGRRIDVQPWCDLSDEFGVKVVFDAAAGFDSWRACAPPAMISLHATKLFGVGEGGLIVTTDESVAGLVRQRTNFGFRGSRETGIISANAKMSEYHAAVGLAALARYPETRAQYARVRDTYRRNLSSIDGVRLFETANDPEVTATVVLEFERPVAEPVAEALGSSGIESRAWWEFGCHVQPAFRTMPRLHPDLPATDMIARRTLGVPCFPDLDEETIDRICDRIADAMTGLRKRGGR